MKANESIAVATVSLFEEVDFPFMANPLFGRGKFLCLLAQSA